MIKKKITRVLWMVIGLISFGLGTLGAVLPVLPTVPFYMAAAFCFARSSERLNNWLLGTKLYKHYIESIVQKKAMTLKKKITVLGTITIMMGVGFACMSNVPIGRLCIAVVWIGHLFYFAFRIETIKKDCNIAKESEI